MAYANAVGAYPRTNDATTKEEAISIVTLLLPMESTSALVISPHASIIKLNSAVAILI